MKFHSAFSPTSRSFSGTGRIATLLPVMLAITSLAQAATPTITTAIVNTTTNTLSITGTSLLGADSVGVSSVTLAGIALTVTGQTATSITATFPAASPASSLAPGTYPLIVSFFGSTRPNSVSFQATVGPQTRLLFSSVAAIPASETLLAITNVSLDPTTGALGAPGSCTLNFFGTNAPPETLTLGPIQAGNYANITVGGGFAGYVYALCSFKAQGVALGGNLTTVVWAIPAVVNP